jgi:hypothetical protein
MVAFVGRYLGTWVYGMRVDTGVRGLFLGQWGVRIVTCWGCGSMGSDKGYLLTSLLPLLFPAYHAVLCCCVLCFCIVDVAPLGSADVEHSLGLVGQVEHVHVRLAQLQFQFHTLALRAEWRELRCVYVSDSRRGMRSLPTLHLLICTRLPNNPRAHQSIVDMHRPHRHDPRWVVVVPAVFAPPSSPHPPHNSSTHGRPDLLLPPCLAAAPCLELSDT